jgi:esterase/lipase
MIEKRKEYFRNYRKTHREQYNEYQRRYRNKLKGKHIKPLGTLKKLEDLQQRIDKAIDCIKEFLCTEEYINVDGGAIADNYFEILQILKGAK